MSQNKCEGGMQEWIIIILPEGVIKGLSKEIVFKVKLEKNELEPTMWETKS
jgi:hypothetical protein